jgi:hypothetical protein
VAIFLKTAAMKLVLSMGSTVLECVDIRLALAKNEDFLQALRRAMQVKHKPLLLSPGQRHAFYLEASSKVGHTKKKN